MYTIQTHTHTHTHNVHYIIFKFFIVLSHPLGTMPREIKQVIISRRITLDGGRKNGLVVRWYLQCSPTIIRGPGEGM